MNEREPKIKICGLTRPEESEYLNEYSVDYAGFVFYEKSKRNISFERADEIMKNLNAAECVVLSAMLCMCKSRLT